MKNTKKFLILSFLFVFYGFSLCAEVFSSSKFAWTIDFPEGTFISAADEDERSILFENSFFPVQIIIRIWEDGKFTSPVEALSYTIEKLGGTGDFVSSVWRNKNCAVSAFSISDNGMIKNASGRAVSIPLTIEKNILTVTAYYENNFPEADNETEAKANSILCDLFVISVLDSIMADRGSFFEEGIITSFAFPKEKPEEISLEIGGKKINSSINSADGEANQFVIDREFEIFKKYASSDYWKEAWQRFYRIIARDECGRLKKLSFDIYTSLAGNILQQKNLTDTEKNFYIAQEILSLVQNFNYARSSSTKDRADFSNISDTLKNIGSDCDSRSLLAMCILRNLGIDSCMFISVEYSHAMLGVNLSGNVNRNYKMETFEIDGKQYVFGETTKKGLELGKIVSGMTDKTKWVPVEFYE